MALDPNYGSRVLAQAREMAPQAFAAPDTSPLPAPPPVPSSMTQPQGTAAGPQSDGGFPGYVQQMQGNGPKLAAEKLDELKNKYLVERLLPREHLTKGIDNTDAKVLGDAFGSKADAWIQQYLATPDAAAAAAGQAKGPERGWGQAAWETLHDASVQGINFLAHTPSGIAAGVDYLGRAERGMVNEFGHMGDAVDRAHKIADDFRKGGVHALISDYEDYLGQFMGDRTTVGKLGADASAGLNNYFNPMMSQASNTANQNIAAAKGVAGHAMAILHNPAAIPGMVGQVAGMLGPAALARIPAFAETLNALPKLSQALAVNAIAATPASLDSTAQFEKSMRDKSYEELTANNPRAQELYRSFVSLGLPEATAKQRVKDGLINSSTFLVGATNLATDVGIGALIPGGAEHAVAGVGMHAGQGGFLRTVARGVVPETVEESTANYAQQVAQNAATNNATGSNIPLTQGAAESAVEGGLVGGLVGGATHLPQAVANAGNPLRRQQVAPPATNTNAPAAANEATAGPPPASAAPTGPAPAPTAGGLGDITTNPGAGIPDAVHAPIVTQAVETTAARLSRKTTAAAVANADAQTVIEQAHAAAQKAAGEEWANMSPLQRLDIVGAVAEKINTVAKKPEVAGTLQAMRNGLQEAPTPAGTDTAGPQEAAPVEGQETASGTQEAPAAETQETPPAAQQTPLTETVPPVAPSPPTAPTTPAAPVAAQEQAPAAVAPSLPGNLAGAKPRYNAGADGYLPDFTSDVDKAFYIIGQKLRSKNDAKYRQWLVSQGFKEGSLDGIAASVRAAVAAQMQQHTPGTASAPAVVHMPESGALTMLGQDVATPTQAGRGKPLKAPPPPPVTTETTATPTATANPLKGKRRPKEQAPPETPVGQTVEQTQQTPPATQINEAPAPARERADDAVERIAGEDLAGKDKEDVAQAIELAREGDSGELGRLIKELQGDESITREQAAALREAARQSTPSEQGLTEHTEQTPAPSVDEPYVPKAKNFSDLVKEIIGGNHPAKVKALLEGMQHLALPRPYVWLADKMAGIVGDMGVSLRYITNEDEAAHVAAHPTVDAARLLGQYDRATNTVLLRPETSPKIILHEILHAITSNVLIAKARSASVQQFQRQMESLLAHIQDSIKNDTNGARTNMPADIKAWLDGYKAGPFSNTRELLAYGLTEPSIMGYLRTLPGLPGTKAGKSAWTGFKDAIRSFFGVQEPEQRNALDSLIETSGQLIDHIGNDPGITTDARIDVANSKYNFAGLTNDVIDLSSDPSVAPTEVPKEVDATPTTMVQRTWEIFSIASLGIEKSMQEVIKAGGKINAAINPYFAMRKYTSDIAEMRNTDNQEVVEPLTNWITKHWESFGSKTWQDFRTDLDKFLQNYHALNERNPSMWAEQVPLRNGMDIERAVLIDDAYDGHITQEQLQAQLKTLAQQHAAQTLEEWAKANGARHPDRAREVLADVATRGFTPERLAELNTLMQAARDRTRERMQAAGVIHEGDPFADRGWKWYVPLKGSMEATEEGGDYDMGARRGATRAFRDRNLATLQGRSTNAANALSQMVVDMNQAATSQAEGDFKGTLYDYVMEHQDLLGARVRRWTGTPKSGYETNTAFDSKGRPVAGKSSRQELPTPTWGFMYNQGDEHFEVLLPEGSQLMRGIAGLRKVTSPTSLEQSHSPIASMFQGLKTATNIFSRAYTTWSPTWQLTTAFLRDCNYIPSVIMAQVFDNPAQAAPFAKNYAANLAKNVAALGNTSSGEWKTLLGDRSAMAAFAEKNPDSFVAKLMAFRNAGGSTEYGQSFNQESASDVLFGKAKQQADLTVSLTGALTGTKMAYKAFNDVTSHFAAMMESRGRVAAWEALVQTGMDPKEAAARVKGVLDYGQSGEWGTMLNAVHAFYRVSATDADTIRRTFTTPDGKLDKKKLTWWVPTFAAMGAAAYMLGSSALGDSDDKDKDGKPIPRMHKLTGDTISSKIVLPGPNGTVIGLPIAMGLPQLLMALGTLSAAVAAGHLSGAEATDAYYKTITRTTPIAPTGVRKGSGAIGIAASWIEGTVIPTIAQPIVEAHDNLSAFGTPIHNEHGSDSDKFASDSGRGGTAEFWKDRARELHDMTGIDVYPETLQHLTKSYGGQPVNQLLRWTVDKDNKERAGTEVNSLLTASRLGVNDEQFYYSSQMYKTLDDLQVAKRQMKHAGDKDAQEEWLRKNPEAAKQVEAWGTLNKAREDYYKEIASIRSNKILSDQGRKDKAKLADGKLRRAVEAAQKVADK